MSFFDAPAGTRGRGLLSWIQGFGLMRFIGFALPLFLLAPASFAGEQAPLQGLDRYIAKSMKAWHIPGLAIAVVKDGQIVMAKGFGVRRLGGSARVDENTVFGIASNSKLFTTVSLGMLVDSGKLKWNSRVADYLRDFELYDPYPSREVTVRDLLTHRSGNCDAEFLWYGSTNTRADIIRKLRLVKPRHSFRARYCYSNNMIMVAGQIVPAVTGETWDKFVQARIFKPLRMTHSSTSIRALESQRDVATPHARVDGSVQPIHWVNVDNVGPAAGVNSSVGDMAQWLIMLLGDGEYQGRRIVSPNVVQTIETPKIVIPESDSERKLSRKFEPRVLSHAYGFTLNIGDYHGERIVWHGGDIDGMESKVGMIPDLNLGVVVLSNLENNRLVGALVYRVFDAYLHVPKQDWSASFLAMRKARRAKRAKKPDKLADSRVPGVRPPLPLADYAGVYGDSLHGPIKISVEDGHLVLHRGKIFVGDLEPWNHDLFRVVWRYHYLGKSYVQFGLDPTGRPDTLTLLRTGTPWPLTMRREEEN